MTNLEKLLVHTQEQTAALIKAGALLSEVGRQLVDAQNTIINQRAEIELLKLDLAEARAG